MLAKLDQFENHFGFVPFMYAILGNVSLIIMQINMRTVALVFTPFYAQFIRGVLLLTINTLILKSNKIDTHQPNPETFILLIKRSFSASCSLIFLLTSVMFVPLGIANSLFNLAPVIIYFIEYFGGSGSIQKENLFLTLICFIGVIFIIKPGFLFSSNEQEFSFFLIMPVIAAFGQAFSMFYLHKLKGKVSTLVALEYFYILQTLLTPFIQNFCPLEVKGEINLSLLGSIVILVISAYFAQLMNSRAIYLRKPSLIMPFGYTGIILAFLIDIIFEGAQFDFYSVIGIIMTSSGLLSTFIVKEK